MKFILFKILIIFSHMFVKSQVMDIINPIEKVGLSNWSIVNDDVMGGISTSFLSLNDENNLIFNGNLSLENNGGFASSRMVIADKNLTGVKSIKIKFKGDGNIYKLRLNQTNRRVSYSCDFKSKKDKWDEINILITDFKPTWRGYTYNDYPPVDLDKINSLGLQISDKQEGKFELEIQYIKALYK